MSITPLPCCTGDGPICSGLNTPRPPPFDHGRAAHADVAAPRGNDDVAAAQQRRIPAKQRPATIPTTGTWPLSRAKLAKVATCRPATMGMSTSPGRPPPPSANSTTGSCSAGPAQHAVGLLVVAHALRAGQHRGVVGHGTAVRDAGEETTIDAADAGDHAVGRGVLDQVFLRRRRLCRHRQGAVFDKAAGVAQIGQILARAAQAQGMALGHSLGAAGILCESLAVHQAQQIGAWRTAWDARFGYVRFSGSTARNPVLSENIGVFWHKALWNMITLL
jgi:hypothetical protein